MKKLLIFLLLTLGLIGTTYAKLCPDGSYITGSRCKLCPDGSYVDGSSGSSCRLTPGGTYISGGSGMKLCPDGSYVSGNRCKLCPDGTYIGGNRCKLQPDGSYGNSSSYSNSHYNNNSNSYQPGAGMMLNARDIGRREGEAYEALGNLITSIFGSGNSTPSKKSYYRLYEYGSTWTITSNSLFSSDGKRCTNYATSASCDNGVTYRQCGNSICGSDGTSYTKKGNCRYTSFGASCCGPKSKIVCR